MAGSTKKKGKIHFEHQVLKQGAGGAIVSAEEKCKSTWNPGKIVKTEQRHRTRTKGKNPATIIVSCGKGENRAMRKINGKNADGTTIAKLYPCVSEYQDKLYGKGMRVANLNEGKGGAHSYACSVCFLKHKG